jgi:hypothetical protein
MAGLLQDAHYNLACPFDPCPAFREDACMEKNSFCAFSHTRVAYVHHALGSYENALI